MNNITLTELEAEKQKCIDAISLAYTTFQSNTGIFNPDIRLNISQSYIKDKKIYSCSPSITVTI
jgi:hypothetical protein